MSSKIRADSIAPYSASIFTISSSVTASAYYGDGSNLTGVGIGSGYPFDMRPNSTVIKLAADDATTTAITTDTATSSLYLAGTLYSPSNTVQIVSSSTYSTASIVAQSYVNNTRFNFTLSSSLGAYTGSGETIQLAVQSAGFPDDGPQTITFIASTIFVPTSIASCSLWLDADDASSITLNGTDVSQWDDKSGNGNHYGQTTAAAQPAYSASVINGLYVVATDGGLGYEQYLTRSSTTDYVDSSQHFTTFIVAQQWKDHGGLGTTIGLYFSFGGTSGASYGNYFNHFMTNGSLIRSNYYIDASDIDYTIPGGNAAWQGVNKILTNRSYSSGTELRIAGSLALLETAGNPTINGTGWSGISSYKDNGGDDGSWYFAEIIHYARGLTDTECETVEAYLSAKWGIALS